MDLDQRIKRFLEASAAKPERSKLAPFDELLRTLRKRRWTFVEIAQALEKEFGLKVNPKTIWAYLQVKERAKQREEAEKPITPAPAAEPRPKRRFNLDA